MMDELKPCPHCGKAVDIALSSYGKNKERWFVVKGESDDGCSCRVFMYSDEFLSQRDADGCKQRLIAAWNHRPAPENKPLTLEQLRQMDFRSYPIWDSCLNTWCCCRTDSGADGKAIYYFGGGNRPLEANRFYSRKPVDTQPNPVWEQGTSWLTKRFSKEGDEC